MNNSGEKESDERHQNINNFYQRQLNISLQFSEHISEIVTKSVPDMKQLLIAIPKIELPLIRIGNISPLISINRTVAENLDASTKPLIELVKKFSEDYQQSLVGPLAGMWSEQISNLVKNVGKIASYHYPPNWQGEGLLKLADNLETLLLDEGLPLAWVPPRHILAKVIQANTSSERRRVLYSNRMCIITACEQELKSIGRRELDELIAFVLESIEAMRNGHWKASQALSTNVMDTIVSQLFDKSTKIAIRNHKTRISWKEYPVKEALVLGGIWGAYLEYWPDGKSNNIPQQYTRHASAHGVSRRQYTNINALIALMHVVGLLKLIASEQPDTNRAIS